MITIEITNRLSRSICKNNNSININKKNKKKIKAKINVNSLNLK